MRVTIICDASFCDQYKVAGYGYWIASARTKCGGSGYIVKEVENNNTAEMIAIANSVWRGINDRLIYHSDTLLIQTDCTSAIAKLSGTQVCKTVQEYDVCEYFNRIVQSMNLLVSFRHVRGHTGIADSRSEANRMCDRKAKHEMRLARINKINGIEL
jgi:ribonuclease HI